MRSRFHGRTDFLVGIPFADAGVPGEHGRGHVHGAPGFRLAAFLTMYNWFP